MLIGDHICAWYLNHLHSAMSQCVAVILCIGYSQLLGALIEKHNRRGFRRLMRDWSYDHYSNVRQFLLLLFFFVALINTNVR